MTHGHSREPLTAYSRALYGRGMTTTEADMTNLPTDPTETEREMEPLTVASVQVGQRVQIPWDKKIVTITRKRCVHRGTGAAYYRYVYRRLDGPATPELRYDNHDTYEIGGKLDDGTEYKNALADFVALEIELDRQS